MMIRRVKWLEFAGKGKDLAGMTADTANTPHRGISATSASSTLIGGLCSAAGGFAQPLRDFTDPLPLAAGALAKRAKGSPACRVFVHVAGHLESKLSPHRGIPSLRSGVPARLRRGDAKQTKGSLAGTAPPLTGDSVALLRHPRPPAAGFAESHQKIQLK